MMFKTCTGDYCKFKFQDGALAGCKYCGYCEFQRPKDPRVPDHEDDSWDTFDQRAE